MQAQWKSIQVPGNPAGVTRYSKGFSKAEIHREPGHGVQAELKEGFLGLGTHVGGSYGDASQSDKAILAKLEDTAHPPRFDHWQETPGPKDTPDTRHYRGEKASGHGKVDAYITRVGDEANVTAQAGIFGVQIEGHFFAPAPNDREILQRISRP